jgi:hypothetical protein
MNCKLQRLVRHCPTCRHWWFDRIRRGCRIDERRATNTTYMLGSDTACGPCEDYEPNTQYVLKERNYK